MICLEITANRPSRPHITRVAQRKNNADAQQDCEGGYPIPVLSQIFELPHTREVYWTPPSSVGVMSLAGSCIWLDTANDRSNDDVLFKHDKNAGRLSSRTCGPTVEAPGRGLEKQVCPLDAGMGKKGSRKVKSQYPRRNATSLVLARRSFDEGNPSQLYYPQPLSPRSQRPGGLFVIPARLSVMTRYPRFLITCGTRIGFRRFALL
ncbi:hypothetical protein Bbelb_166090 [Branchiostoma belcheri]|nr:hypothetical protein Bbelb_166090 [Branchiostoma belcheri]